MVRNPLKAFLHPTLTDLQGLPTFVPLFPDGLPLAALRLVSLRTARQAFTLRSIAAISSRSSVAEPSAPSSSMDLSTAASLWTVSSGCSPGDRTRAAGFWILIPACVRGGWEARAGEGAWVGLQACAE